MLNRFARLFGYSITKINNQKFRKDFGVEIIELIKTGFPYTMTSSERIGALSDAVKYIIQNNIEGDFVECGVWKGGSTLAMALTLEKSGIVNRKLFLYDTFEGMTDPTAADKDLNNSSAKDLLQTNSKETSAVWAYSGLDEVKRTMSLCKYDTNNFIYVKGKVEETLLSSNHQKIALMRLNTDWYESTKIELEVLFPKLVSGGVLIIDDYRYWQGARKVVDEYMEKIK